MSRRCSNSLQLDTDPFLVCLQLLDTRMSRPNSCSVTVLLQVGHQGYPPQRPFDQSADSVIVSNAERLRGVLQRRSSQLPCVLAGRRPVPLRAAQDGEHRPPAPRAGARMHHRLGLYLAWFHMGTLINLRSCSAGRALTTRLAGNSTGSPVDGLVAV